MKKRPFPYHERSNAKTTTATTTTTTTEETIYEESGDDDGVADRLAHMTLPSNATSIRSDITDNFSCEGRIYGYYADVENDCQIFHVCLPVTYPDGKETQFRWSFICPEETTFNQVSDRGLGLAGVFGSKRPDQFGLPFETSTGGVHLRPHR